MEVPVPSSLKRRAEEVIHDLLPKKSKERYNLVQEDLFVAGDGKWRTWNQSTQSAAMNLINFMLTFSYFITTRGLKGISFCPADSELRTMISSFAKDISLEDLDGTWMEVQLPESESKGLVASYSIFRINQEKTKIEIEGYDFKKPGGIDTYFEHIVRKYEGGKGVFTWHGSYSEGSLFYKDTYVFYADKNVLGFYSCDPSMTLEDGWDVGILVHASKHKDLLSTSDNAAKASLTAALAELSEIKDKESKWKISHNVKFGLFGNIVQLDFHNLKPEVYVDDDH